jgi:predicted nucleic acid-binding protein
LDSEVPRSRRRIVVADTGPIRYLYLIGQIGVLPTLFQQIHVPAVVYSEMVHSATPSSLRNWARTHLDWLLVEPTAELPIPDRTTLDDGEWAAIALAGRISADLVLMDDRKGVRFAEGMGFEVVGTLGVLDLAARRGHLDLLEAFDRLKATNFRYKPEMLANMLDEDRKRRL